MSRFTNTLDWNDYIDQNLKYHSKNLKGKYKYNFEQRVTNMIQAHNWHFAIDKDSILLRIKQATRVFKSFELEYNKTYHMDYFLFNLIGSFIRTRVMLEKYYIKNVLHWIKKPAARQLILQIHETLQGRGFVDEDDISEDVTLVMLSNERVRLHFLFKMWQLHYGESNQYNSLSGTLLALSFQTYELSKINQDLLNQRKQWFTGPNLRYAPLLFWQKQDSNELLGWLPCEKFFKFAATVIKYRLHLISEMEIFNMTIEPDYIRDVQALHFIKVNDFSISMSETTIAYNPKLPPHNVVDMILARYKNVSRFQSTQMLLQFTKAWIGNQFILATTEDHVTTVYYLLCTTRHINLLQKLTILGWLNKLYDTHRSGWYCKSDFYDYPKYWKYIHEEFAEQVDKWMNDDIDLDDFIDFITAGPSVDPLDRLFS